MHGVERWRSDCGCNGGKPGWNQAWRAPLRQALDELRDALAPLTEQEGGKLFKDVWAARDGYIQVILDRSPETVERFLRKHQLHPLTEDERVRALELMEMQRHTQLMYTSCGWFFDDISGIETVQIIAYAARVLQLATAFRRAGGRARAGVSGAPGRSAIQRSRGRRWRADLSRASVATMNCAWSRWRRITPSVRSSPPLPRRRTSSATAFAASPTRSTPQAAVGWPWAGPGRQRHHRPAAELFLCGASLRRPEHHRRGQALRAKRCGGV